MSHIFSSSVNSLANDVRMKCNGQNFLLWSVGMILQTHTVHHDRNLLNHCCLLTLYSWLVETMCHLRAAFYFIIFFVQHWTCIQYFWTILWIHVHHTLDLLMQDIFTELSGTFFLDTCFTEVLHCTYAVFDSEHDLECVLCVSALKRLKEGHSRDMI